MDLDGAVVHLKAGDVLVLRGTILNWINRGTEPCVIAVSLIAAKRLRPAARRFPRTAETISLYSANPHPSPNLSPLAQAGEERGTPRSIALGDLPSSQVNSPEARGNQRRHPGLGPLPHAPAFPSRETRIAQRSALAAPLRAARTVRVLVGNGQMAW